MNEEERVKALQERVVAYARTVRAEHSAWSWERCLEASAMRILDPRWSYEIAPFFGTSDEPAHFFLTQFDNG